MRTCQDAGNLTWGFAQNDAPNEKGRRNLAGPFALRKAAKFELMACIQKNCGGSHFQIFHIPRFFEKTAFALPQPQQRAAVSPRPPPAIMPGAGVPPRMYWRLRC